MSEKPISYIDTQGMSGPWSEADKKAAQKQEHKPAIVTPRRVLTHLDVKELKILINEVLDERDGKMDYDSYFDVEKFKHYVGEEEPKYRP